MSKTRQTRASAVTVLLLTAGVLAGCSTVQETGRRQFIIVSPGEEMQLGLTAFEQMKKETPISREPKINAMVQRVGQRVAAVADLPGAQWEFVVFESKEPNAFCLPGGKVGIYTGILPITRDEAGLATVISHEVAHASKRHGAERMSRAMVRQTGGELAGQYLGGKEGQYQGAVQQVYGIGIQLVEALPHSRTQETEADQVGLLYMAKAGYDPEAAIGFWQRFAEFNQQTGQASTGLQRYLRTHPTDDQRIRDLQAWLPRAKAAMPSEAP